MWELCKKLLRLHYAEQVDNQVNLREKWQKDFNDVDKRINALLELYISGHLEKDDYVKKKNELLAEKTSLAEKLNDSGQSINNWLQQTEDFFGLAHAAYETFKSPKTTLTRKKQILQDIGWNLELFDGKLRWEYKKPFDFLVERQPAFISVGTRVFSEGKKKNTSLEREVLFWRSARDPNRMGRPVCLMAKVSRGV